MKKSEYLFVIKALAAWLAVLFVVLFLAVQLIPFQEEFVGGGLGNYLSNPFIWAWSNFDGEHYLSLVQNGYQPLTYFFFPLYPIVIKIFSLITGTSLAGYNLAGILVSYLSLAFAVFGLYKLLKIDFKENLVKISIILLLFFPTSFYLGSVYTESLFLALTVWFFYFARKKNYLIAGILAGFSTATRVIGIILPASLLIEMLINKDNVFKLKNILSLAVSVSGIILYMYYLKQTTGNYLEFFSSVGVFGEQRESSIVFLPQVFYRYVFKILPNLHTSYFPILFSTFLEFLVAIVFLVFSVISFFKLRLSYSVYLVLGYLIPTFSGSFSSLPRYVLVLFPIYILLAQYLTKRKYFVFAFSFISFILLVVSLALFVRGYWIS